MGIKDKGELGGDYSGPTIWNLLLQREEREEILHF